MIVGMNMDAEQPRNSCHPRVSYLLPAGEWPGSLLDFVGIGNLLLAKCLHLPSTVKFALDGCSYSLSKVV